MRRALQAIRRYHITDRDDYKKYNKIAGLATKLVGVLKRLPSTDPARIELTDQVLDKYVCPPLNPFLPVYVQIDPLLHSPNPPRVWSGLNSVMGVLVKDEIS
jgi:U3 small nucleolar ribonucleoprotein protein IMP3